MDSATEGSMAKRERTFELRKLVYEFVKIIQKQPVIEH